MLLCRGPGYQGAPAGIGSCPPPKQALSSPKGPACTGCVSIPGPLADRTEDSPGSPHEAGGSLEGRRGSCSSACRYVWNEWVSG